MSKGLLVDSDVVIDFLRGDDRAKTVLKVNSASICFSAVTVAEIYAGIKSEKEATEVDRLFAAFPVVTVSHAIARQAGSLVKRYRPSHSLEIPDALIAATCMVSELELCTRNVKHYPMFPSLQPPYRLHPAA